ncbi:MAG: hypothetical protein H6534_06860 [Chthonomonadaceae bacterium]|nr:hypothetical protein [Chthonomonadaceae bacterium]
MRALAITPCLGLAGLALAQLPTTPISAGFRVLTDRGLIKPPPRLDPQEPSGFPGLPPKSGALPPPQSQDRTLQILQTGTVERVGQQIVLDGGVHVQYEGYDIFANRVEGDLDTQVFFLTGQVKLIGIDSVVTGGAVQVMFKERSFRATDGEAQLRPSFLKGRTLDDVYLGGKLTYGSEREAFASQSYFTTCNLDHPHYVLDSRFATVRPGRRLILRDVEIRILDHRILRLPYVSIPLEDYSDRYLPDVGQSRDEGYYVRTRTGVPLPSPRTSLDARVDYYTKLGGGLGADYRYEHAKSSGQIQVFGLTGGPGSLQASNRHSQTFGAFTIDVSNEYQRNNYLTAPQSTLLSTRGNLMYRQGASNTRLSFMRTGNNSPGFSFEQQTTTLSDQRTWSKALRTTLDLNLVANKSEFSSGTPIERQQLDVRFRGQQDLQRATAELEYIRSIPVGETTNFFSASDRTPVFTLRSSSQQMFGSERAGLGMPFQTQLSLGEFVDSRSRSRISRGYFDFAFQRPDTSGKKFTFNWDGKFRQGVYSDDTAQYVVGMGANARYKLGKDTGVNVRYNYLRPFGFSPLQLDRSGEYHQVFADINIRPVPTVLLAVQTGYDLLGKNLSSTNWQTVGVRMEYEPAKWLLFRANSTYDPYQKGWSNLRLDVAYKPGATLVRASARYDGIRKQWGQVAVSVLNLKWGRFQASTDLVYNGYLKQFEARHFDFRYDLHCAEAVLQIIDNPLGFRSGREINFFFRLKAFPFNTGYGTGQRGQAIGGGTGRDF